MLFESARENEKNEKNEKKPTGTKKPHQAKHLTGLAIPRDLVLFFLWAVHFESTLVTSCALLC
jgi:hypothetical protein